MPCDVAVDGQLEAVFEMIGGEWGRLLVFADRDGQEHRWAMPMAMLAGSGEELRAELLPGCTPAELLELAQWPKGKGTVLVVGHQPVLGQTIAELVGFSAADCSVRKGAVWWLRQRQRLESIQTVIVTVQSPEVL